MRLADSVPDSACAAASRYSKLAPVAVAAPWMASLTLCARGPLKMPLMSMLRVASSRGWQAEGRPTERPPGRFAELAFMVNEALTRGSKSET